MPSPELFRVFPWVDGAPPRAAGGALHVPRDRQGAGRVDHPERYGVLYLASSAPAAVAERLQGFRGTRLTGADLRVRSGGRSVPLALARFVGAEGMECDLDAPAPLAERSLIPSDVATRDRTITQAWASRIRAEHRWHGVRYWSSLEAKWPVVARWSFEDLEVQDVEPLTVSHPALRDAAVFLAIAIGP